MVARKMPKDKNIAINVMIPLSLRDSLKAMGDQEFRTLSGEIRMALENHVKKGVQK